ncbi:MAG: molybdate ABC transporter substrate-binding protein [Planctomycetota bacterium]|nr:MAG: molybdate ABC transporter substrate-binding protein [Planctomycetota bacterium]
MPQSPGADGMAQAGRRLGSIQQVSIMTRTLLILAASAATLVVVVALLFIDDSSRRAAIQSNGSPADGAGPAPLMVYCAASNRAVLEAIRRDYVEETGREVQIQYGPSQTLLSQIQVGGIGDLYLPADDSFLQLARDQGLVEEILPIAHMQAVVVVAAGNPLQIATLDDLLAERVRLVQANPEAAAIAKLVKEEFSRQGLWERVDRATDAYRTTVTDVVNDVVVGAADAGIVYDAVLHPFSGVGQVELPELSRVRSRVAVGVLKSSRDPAAALHFARYISAVDRGLQRYREHGFRVGQGDRWADVPELTIYAGSMLRPAIEDTITAFERREGVRVTRVYNGCGILVGQMKGGHHPDAYFACDAEFMNQVADLFSTPVPVTQNELVILVQKGNPHRIASLRDLARPGLRVGIGHEKQCAMGWLTQLTFEQGGVRSEVMPNVTVQTPTGDMLVNQLLTGSLDAAVAYLSNAVGAGDRLDAIRIEGIPCAVATQPWAVAKDSPYPAMAQRLFERIRSVESRQEFEANGFRWTLGSESETASEPVSSGSP